MNTPRNSFSAVKSPRAFRYHNLLFLLFGIVLGKYHPLLYTTLTNHLRNLQPQCQLGRICFWYHRRPLLHDGRLSSPLWDVPRKHMSQQYSIVPKLLTPSSRVRMQRTNPALVWVSNAVNPAQLRALQTSAHHVFQISHSEQHIQQVELPLHQLDNASANIVRNMLRLLGFASNRYVHRVVLRRYTTGSAVQATAQRWQTFGTRNSTPCTLAAVAQLTLRAPEKGGALTHLWRNSSSADQADDGENDVTFRAATEEGDVFAWYVVQPMTETMAWRLWQGMDAVQSGVKVVMETQIRSCWKKVL